ncbi:MAG: GTP pyrophosphokinase family protein [Eubacterium sp.]|nr:GTP pyrophosphokinase family protein [Eubacterium sp.]MDD7208753.1 GTP pyrophosphokinase family protein [Lachnospiraceae bacterium]MDY5497780.1 GTP pyrophosphokinase family protein [Anaerobutyricum sp.]
MEQRKKMFGAIDDLLRSPIGEKIRSRLFQQLTTKEIQEMLAREQEPFKTLMAYYQCALMEVETKFRVLNEEFSLAHDRNPIESIKTRLKSLESIMEKMNRRNLPFSSKSIEENLFDIAGIRVICSFREDIYLLADCLLEQDDVTLIERKDYIKNPKDNGYRSLHLIIEIPIFLEHQKKKMKVEVQLRTIAMDFWASLEHKLKYKKNIASDQLTEKLKQCAEESASLDLKMDEIRKEIEQLHTDSESVSAQRKKR